MLLAGQKPISTTLLSCQPLLYAGAFAKTHRIPSYDVGPDHRLTIPGLLRHLHDVAQSHASHYGFGYHGLLPEGRSWALASMELHFVGSLPFGEADLNIATSVSRAAGAVVFRDYAASANDEVIVYGQSMWALIDLETRLTASPSDSLRACMREIAHRLDDMPTLKRLPASAPLPRVDKRRVRLHDCDFNGHLNNTVSVQWMLDALTLGGTHEFQDHALQASRLSAKLLRVTYHQEATLGQSLHVGLARRDSSAFNPLGQNTFLELRTEKDELIVNAEIGYGDQPE